MVIKRAVQPANDHDLGLGAPLLQLLVLAASYLPAAESGLSDTARELNLHLNCAIIAAMRLSLESKTGDDDIDLSSA